VIRSAAQLNPRQRDLLIRDFVQYLKWQTNRTVIGSLNQRQREALFAELVE
jgi:hypothetical protein